LKEKTYFPHWQQIAVKYPHLICTSTEKKNLGFVNALVFQSPWMDRATIETTVEVLIKEIVRSSPSTRIWTIRKPIEGDGIYDVYHVLPNKKVVNR
jgi:hypothetical protein